MLTWAHKTYAEYLAARFLVTHGFALAQIRPLIFHAASMHRVVPQMAGTAAWLATLRVDVRDELRRCDPRILLDANLVILPDAERHALTQALLTAFAEGTATDSSLDSSAYRNLSTAPQNWVTNFLGDFGRLLRCARST